MGVHVGEGVGRKGRFSDSVLFYKRTNVCKCKLTCKLG